MGYKFAFKNNNGTYKNDTSFEDIYSLYLFDKMLKLITDYDKEIGSLNRNQLLSIMHLPEDFEII